MRFLLIAAGFFGLDSIVLAALGSHHFAQTMTATHYIDYQIAVQFELFHSLALLAIALFSLSRKKSPIVLNAAAYCFIIGILFFSGGIYLNTIFNVTGITFITPIGGLAFIAGWLLIFFAGFQPGLKNR